MSFLLALCHQLFIEMNLIICFHEVNQSALLHVFVSVLQFESLFVPLMANCGKEDVATALAIFRKRTKGNRLLYWSFLRKTQCLVTLAFYVASNRYKLNQFQYKLKFIMVH